MRRLTRRQRTSAIVLTVIALCFITLDLGGGSLRAAHNGVRGTLGSLYRGTDSALGPVRRWLQSVPSAGADRGRIDALRRDNAELRGRLAAITAQQQRAARAAKLTADASLTGTSIVTANVTALGPGDGFDWTLTLDAGTGAGVRVGQTVTDGFALVGRVLHADADSCVVLLATDPGSGIGVRDERSGELGVATGGGTAGFAFEPLSPDVAVHPGDRLTTGPVGSTSYQAGLAVGTVTSVSRAADGTVRAAVRPATSPTAVDVVAVVTSPVSSLAGASGAQAPTRGHR